MATKISYRPITKDDLPDRVRWFADREVGKFFGSEIRFGTTIEDQQKWFKKLDSDERIDYMIEVDEKSVGSVGTIEINKVDKNAGIYIFIGERDYWRKGIASKAIQYVTDIAFNDLKLHKL